MECRAIALSFFTDSPEQSVLAFGCWAACHVGLLVGGPGLGRRGGFGPPWTAIVAHSWGACQCARFGPNVTIECTLSSIIRPILRQL